MNYVVSNYHYHKNKNCTTLLLLGTIDEENILAVANYLAALTLNAIKEMFLGAKEIMEWLAEAATKITKETKQPGFQTTNKNIAAKKNNNNDNNSNTIRTKQKIIMIITTTQNQQHIKQNITKHNETNETKQNKNKTKQKTNNETKRNETKRNRCHYNK